MQNLNKLLTKLLNKMLKKYKLDKSVFLSLIKVILIN